MDRTRYKYIYVLGLINVSDSLFVDIQSFTNCSVSCFEAEIMNVFGSDFFYFENKKVFG